MKLLSPDSVDYSAGSGAKEPGIPLLSSEIWDIPEACLFAASERLRSTNRNMCKNLFFSCLYRDMTLERQKYAVRQAQQRCPLLDNG
jgi:hypothetical protein